MVQVQNEKVLDHREFMFLALQISDVDRESILRFARTKELFGECIALIPTSPRIFVLAGFAKAGEVWLAAPRRAPSMWWREKPYVLKAEDRKPCMEII